MKNSSFKRLSINLKQKIEKLSHTITLYWRFSLENQGFGSLQLIVVACKLINELNTASHMLWQVTLDTKQKRLAGNTQTIIAFHHPCAKLK